MADAPPSFATWLWTGGVVAIGAGLKWTWDKLTTLRATREAKLSAREEEYVAKMEARLAAAEKRLDDQEAELERHRIALAILVAKEARTNPGSAELLQVQSILGTAFPLHLSIPADMTEKLKDMQ